jgi:hypothetical protein
MKNQTIIVVGIIIAIILLMLFLLTSKFSNIKLSDSLDTCILLTTTVYINTTDYLNDYNSPGSRLQLYIDTINDYIKYTDLTIYVVESSNYSFPEFKNNPRVKVFTFKTDNKIKCNDCSATPYEAESILKAFNYFELKRYNKIIKVTGKYFIPNMETLIKNIPPDADIFFQNTNENNLRKQNSEIFGCKTKFLPEIMNQIIENSKRNMNFESTLYSISMNYKVYTFPPIILTRPVKRSGDNKIMTQL